MDERKDTMTEISISDFCEVINGLNERDRMNFLGMCLAIYPTDTSARDTQSKMAEHVGYRDQIDVSVFCKWGETRGES